MTELTKKHLEVIDYLDEIIQRKDMKLYNRYFNLGMSTGVDNLEKVLGGCPWREGMPDLTGKVLGFANGTSAYVIAQFKHGSDRFLQVSKPEEGDLLKYDYYGYSKDKDMVILTVEESSLCFEHPVNNTVVLSDGLEITEFNIGDSP